MGDTAGGDRPEARVPGLALRKILGGIPPLRDGGHECSFPTALALATKHEYDWIMGCSGAAFTTAIDETTWDPLAAAPLDAPTRQRGARSAGVRLDEVEPPFDDDMRALVLERVKEQLDAGTPPLARGLVGPAEYGLIVGYDDKDGPTFFARTFFDKGAEPSRVGWEAFSDAEHGTPIFLDPVTAPPRTRLIADGLAAGLEPAPRTDAALASWTAALRDDARWADRAHAGSAAFADHAMRLILADQRRAAARFMRGVRAELPLRAQGDALRAAESYGRVVELADKHGTGPFDAAVAMRFLDPGARRGWANLLEQIRRQESEAREALASVRAALA